MVNLGLSLNVVTIDMIAVAEPAHVNNRGILWVQPIFVSCDIAAPWTESEGYIFTIVVVPWYQPCLSLTTEWSRTIVWYWHLLLHYMHICSILCVAAKTTKELWISHDNVNGFYGVNCLDGVNSFEGAGWMGITGGIHKMWWTGMEKWMVVTSWMGLVKSTGMMWWSGMTGCIVMNQWMGMKWSCQQNQNS